MKSVIGSVKRYVTNTGRKIWRKRIGKFHILEINFFSLSSTAQLVLYIGGSAHILPVMAGASAFQYFTHINTVSLARRIFGL